MEEPVLAGFTMASMIKRFARSSGGHHFSRDGIVDFRYTLTEPNGTGLKKVVVFAPCSRLIGSSSFPFLSRSLGRVGLPVNLQDEERWQLGSAASVITPGTTRKHETIQAVRPHRPDFDIFRTGETSQGRKVH